MYTVNTTLHRANNTNKTRLFNLYHKCTHYRNFVGITSCNIILLQMKDPKLKEKHQSNQHKSEKTFQAVKDMLVAVH